MEKCRLIIFTPVYNRVDYIVKCYESMLRQDNQNFVWIIVDDGATDYLEDVVKPWLETEENVGGSAGDSAAFLYYFQKPQRQAEPAGRWIIAL